MGTKEKERELSLALSQFFKLIYVDFGISDFNNKIQRWYELSWDEFRRELENQSVKFNECIDQDWKEFFHLHKEKVQNLLNQKTAV
jgi:hypothetical protein